MIFKDFEPHDLVGAFCCLGWHIEAQTSQRVKGRNVTRNARNARNASNPSSYWLIYKDQSIGVRVSGVSVVPAILLKKSSPWPFYWKSRPKRCGHSGLPGTMETWPSLATAATRRWHGCECQSKLGSSCQQGVVMFFQAWSSRTTGVKEFHVSHGIPLFLLSN